MVFLGLPLPTSSVLGWQLAGTRSNVKHSSQLRALRQILMAKSRSANRKAVGAQQHFPRATSTCLLRGQRVGNAVGHCSWAGSCPRAPGDTAQGQQSNVQIPSHCFHAVGVSFLNSKTRTNKKLRDTIASDNDIPFWLWHFLLLFCCLSGWFLMKVNALCIFFDLMLKDSQKHTEYISLKKLFIFNSGWSSHKWSSGEKKITRVRLLISINNSKSHFNETLEAGD